MPDYRLQACVGGGSNAIGIFHPFRDDKDVKLVGVEAGGEKGLAGGPGTHSLTLSHGTPGVFHGMNTFILQDGDGQVSHTHSVSAGLDYPGVGPEHAFLKASGRASYVGINDAEALDAFKVRLTWWTNLAQSTAPHRPPRNPQPHTARRVVCSP